MKLSLGIKIFIASYMGAVALCILLILLGLFLFGFEKTDKILEGYGLAILLILTVLLMPVVKKYLK